MNILDPVIPCIFAKSGDTYLLSFDEHQQVAFQKRQLFCVTVSPVLFSVQLLTQCGGFLTGGNWEVEADK